MTNQEELFTLCKAVYEATGWETPETVWSLGTGAMGSDEMTNKYTSDYLLPKLQEHGIHLGYDKEQQAWFAFPAGDDGLCIQFSDTPVKALLKLVLKMREEGVL